MNKTARELPEGPLIAWYGDDFTGAAAVMEVLTLSGLSAVLFCEPPTDAVLRQFSDYRGIGIAGASRSKDNLWMEEHLPPVFQSLTSFGAPIIHYKLCSTLDSAPNLGSIGKAIEIGRRYVQSEWVPILVAAPTIHRYQVFGNLFAAVNGKGYRLDRHPTMSRHPITPMAEADVRVHLGRQTEDPVGLVDILALHEGRGEECRQRELGTGRRVLAIDVLDEVSLLAAGELIWEHRGERLFAAGSQGIEYALVAHWRRTAALEGGDRPMRAAPVERVAVVSGSCSQTTARQIDWAEAHGFEPIRLGLRDVFEAAAWSRALREAVDVALRAVRSGRDPLVFTARGPDDPAISEFVRDLAESGQSAADVHQAIGRGLGEILAGILEKSGVRRAVIAGGDTSSHALAALHVKALTLLAPTVPGAGLFKVHYESPGEVPLEIALKGGQMGAVDYLGQIKRGGGAARN